MSFLTSILVLVTKMSQVRDIKGVFAAVLADLSKAFDCIPHGLLIAKLDVFIFDKKCCPLFLPISAKENRKLRWAQNLVIFLTYFPANMYLFKVNNRKSRKRCETCSKLTIKTPKRRQ